MDIVAKEAKKFGRSGFQRAVTGVAVGLLIASAIACFGAQAASWEIFGYSSEYLFMIPGDPAVGFPMPVPKPLPVDWAADIVVGPDGQFYAADSAEQEIVRFDPHTLAATVILEGRAGSLYPSSVAFDAEGDLLFSTYTREGDNDGDSMGIWRIQGVAFNDESEFEAERIIKGSRIRECGVIDSNCRFGPPDVCALISGPYRGDLLVGGRDDVPIFRAIAPDYEILVPFIQDPGYAFPADEDPIPAVLGGFHQVFTTGHVLATDFIKDRILEFDAEGNFVRVFAFSRNANQVTSDSDGDVYVSASSWGGRDFQQIIGFDPDGNMLFNLPLENVKGVLILEE